jgi:hypothetical protein
MRQYTAPTNAKPRTKHYFTEDGTYGLSSDMKVFSTTRWTDEDWQTIENCSDSERLSLATAIDERIANEDLNRALGK